MIEEINEILNELIDIHADKSGAIDFDTNNRARAIWYLQGSGISSVYAVIAMYQMGFALSAAREWRIVNENRELIVLFDFMSDDDRRVRGWYNSGVIERKKDENPGAVHPSLTDEFYKKEQEIRRKLLSELSTFAHPTIKTARYNVHKTPLGEIFDYSWVTLREFPEIKIIIKAALTCAIDNLRFPLRTSNNTQEVRDKLDALYARANQLIPE